MQHNPSLKKEYCWKSRWNIDPQNKKMKGKKFSELPGDLIGQPCLKQQISVWQQTVTDEVLIGAHGHAVAHTQGAQHLQHLQHQQRLKKYHENLQKTDDGEVLI